LVSPKDRAPAGRRRDEVDAARRASDSIASRRAGPQLGSGGERGRAPPPPAARSPVPRSPPPRASRTRPQVRVVPARPSLACRTPQGSPAISRPSSPPPSRVRPRLVQLRPVCAPRSASGCGRASRGTPVRP
jgi:hypothetical protein